jgi:outer membrane immunogenic protein
MFRFSLAALAAVSLSQVAVAADIPVKAPAGRMFVATPVAAFPVWSGWYAGIAGGGAWGQAEQTDPFPFTSGRYDTSGGLVGGTLGAVWQSGSLVFGLETDLSWANIEGTTTGIGGACALPNCQTETRALGTARGRAGLAWNNVMPYVTGGLAYAKVHGAEGVAGAGGAGSQWVTGWTIGTGIEAMLAPQWSAKLEYLYVDLGNQHIFNNSFGGAVAQESLDLTAHVVRVGLNYRFGSW